MPIVFLLIGATLLVAGVQNSQDALFGLLQKDFGETPSFLPWLAGIIVVGAIGYIEPLKNISRGFLALILVGILFSNRGFFAELDKTLKQIAPNAAIKIPSSAVGSVTP